MRAEQACARGRGCEFEAERPKSHLKSSEKMSSSPTYPRRTRTSHQPAMLAVSHHGKGQNYESGSFEASPCSTAVLGRAAATGLGDGLACLTAAESTRTLFERDRKEVPSSASPEFDASELTFEFDAAAGYGKAVSAEGGSGRPVMPRTTRTRSPTMTRCRRGPRRSGPPTRREAVARPGPSWVLGRGRFPTAVPPLT